MRPPGPRCCGAVQAAPGRLAEALQARDPVTRLLASSGFVHEDLRAELFGGALADHAGAAEAALRGRLAGAPGAAPLEAALYLDARLGLVDDMLTYFDRASMACSLEVRVPFLDHELVELAARIPAEHKVRRLQGKHVLRLAARGHVPGLRVRRSGSAASSTRPSAAGSAPPAARSSTRCCSGPDPAYAPVLDRGAVERGRQRVARRARRQREPPAGAGDARALARRLPPACVAAVAPERAARVRPLSYAVVTPARNEERNLRRLGGALAAQTLVPGEWVVVDDGSTDGNAAVLQRVGDAHPWARADPREPRADSERIASGRRAGP